MATNSTLKWVAYSSYTNSNQADSSRANALKMSWGIEQHGSSSVTLMQSRASVRTDRFTAWNLWACSGYVHLDVNVPMSLTYSPQNCQHLPARCSPIAEAGKVPYNPIWAELSQSRHKRCSYPCCREYKFNLVEDTLVGRLSFKCNSLKISSKAKSTAVYLQVLSEADIYV